MNDLRALMGTPIDPGIRAELERLRAELERHRGEAEILRAKLNQLELELEAWRSAAQYEVDR